jgi:hypothetical protein
MNGTPAFHYCQAQVRELLIDSPLLGKEQDEDEASAIAHLPCRSSRSIAAFLGLTNRGHRLVTEKGVGDCYMIAVMRAFNVGQGCPERDLLIGSAKLVANTKPDYRGHDNPQRGKGGWQGDWRHQGCSAGR